MPDLSILKDAHELWGYWGFEPWAYESMEGLYRRVTFSKGARWLGEVARYYAEDYIVWKHRGESDSRLVFATWKPVRDVMTHRFVFVSEGPPLARKRRRSFLFGLKGFLEVYHYGIGGNGDRAIKDLTTLIDKAWEMVQQRPAVRVSE